MSDATQAAVLGALVADSLALGAHWEYDVDKLSSQGRVEALKAPTTFYHKGKKAGDFTHYGDQCHVLLESVAEQKGFDLPHFFESWKALFDGYDGYMDGATRNTLKIIAFGEGPETSGSTSADFAGAARIAPIVHAHAHDLDAAVAAARAQTAMTHNNPKVLDAAEFLVRAALHAAGGMAPVDAMREAAAAGYEVAPIADWLEDGIDSADLETTRAIGSFGQSCGIDAAFPSAVHCIARYPGDLKKALVENVMAGGDQAGRGMAVGMILGAALGTSALPKPWVDGLTRRDAIMQKLEALEQ